MALVNIIRSKISYNAKPDVHRTATSYDIVDTANSMRYKDAFVKVIIPDMVSLERTLIELVKTRKEYSSDR